MKIITTDELYAGVDYQPLNLGTTTGLLTFHTAEEVDGEYTPFRELVVLDARPERHLASSPGIITAEFQTPLAHINVLSANRGTPNMGLRDAQHEPEAASRSRASGSSSRSRRSSGRSRRSPRPRPTRGGRRTSPIRSWSSRIDLSVTDLRDNLDIMDLSNDAARDRDRRVDSRVRRRRPRNYAVLEDAELAGEPVPIQNGVRDPDVLLQPVHGGQRALGRRSRR